VGDLAETIAQVLPPPSAATSQPTTWAWPTGSSSACCPCAASRPSSRPPRCAAWWDELDRASERFLLVKLIGGGFRVGVSKLLVQRAMARMPGSTPSWWPSA
jgi:DNA ligase-1